MPVDRPLGAAKEIQLFVHDHGDEYEKVKALTAEGKKTDVDGPDGEKAVLLGQCQVYVHPKHLPVPA